MGVEIWSLEKIMGRGKWRGNLFFLIWWYIFFSIFLVFWVNDYKL